MTRQDFLAQRRGGMAAAVWRRQCAARLQDALKHPTYILDNRAKWIGRWLYRLAHGQNMTRRTLGLMLRDLPGSCRVCGSVAHMRLGLHAYCQRHRERARQHYAVARIAYWHEKDAAVWERELSAQDRIDVRREQLRRTKA